jgi:hypothetical protein
MNDRNGDGNMHETTIGLLDETIAVLERDGWVKGSYSARAGVPHCLVGALQVAAHIEYWSDEYCSDGKRAFEDYRAAYRAISTHLAAHTTWRPLGFCGCEACQKVTDGNVQIEAWNDVIATSMTEVIEMLNHCKFHLQQQHNELLSRGIKSAELQPA